MSFGLVRIFSNRLAALSSSGVHSLVSFESLLANASFEAALGSSSASAGGRVAHAVGPKVPEVGGVGSELGGRCGRRDTMGREDLSGWTKGEGGTWPSQLEIEGRLVVRIDESTGCNIGVFDAVGSKRGDGYALDAALLARAMGDCETDVRRVEMLFQLVAAGGRGGGSGVNSRSSELPAISSSCRRLRPELFFAELVELDSKTRRRS